MNEVSDKYGWKAVVAYKVRRRFISADYSIIYCPFNLGDEPKKSRSIDISRSREGGPYYPSQALGLDFCRKTISEAKAEWFLPFVQRLNNNEHVMIGEISLEYEKRHGKPMLVLPPGIPYRHEDPEEFFKRYFVVDEE